MARTNRRKVIIGTAALGLAGLSPIEAAEHVASISTLDAELGPTSRVSGATEEDASLLIFGANLARVRRRCQRLARQVRRAGDDKSSWARWSAAVDERTTLLERVARTQARGTAGLAIKMQAVTWELLDDDLVIDEVARKRLAALGRDLGRLVLK